MPPAASETTAGWSWLPPKSQTGTPSGAQLTALFATFCA
jgi:hypothetical protein